MRDTPIDFRKIFKTVPGLYLILDTDLNIIAVNDAYAAATMTKRDEIVTRYIFDVFPDNPTDEHADGVKNLKHSLEIVIKTKKPHTMAVQRYDIKRPDGTFELRYWMPINTPVLNAHNQIDCIIHRAEDITDFVQFKKHHQEVADEAKELQEKVDEMEIEIFKRTKEIQKLNDELEIKIEERTKELRENERKLSLQNKQLLNQNKELEQFTYIASHDLQEPLRSLISFSHLLSSEYNNTLDEDGQKYIEFISSSSRRMQELVKGLLEYARIGKSPELQNINGPNLINEVLMDISAQITEKKAIITFGEIPVFLGYPLEFRLLMQNLLSNALKFVPNGVKPQIEIRAEENEEEYLFSIKDNGIGIDPKFYDKIFTLYRRLHKRNEFDGIGIGLSHCKKIVALHGGNIWVESTLGKGSTFYFTILKQEKK